MHMAHRWGLECLGFLTLTFADHVVEIKEAQRRFNSLATHVLNDRYRAWIAVVERQKSGRLHFHLLVVLDMDIRTGFDFSGIDRKDYSTANAAIRAEWAYWRKTAKLYRFGRTELLPVKSTEEGIGRYMGKYLGKHIGARLPEDKGAKLVRYSEQARHASTRFAFSSEGAREWRRKVGAFCHLVAERYGVRPSFTGVREVLGPSWAYQWRDFIAALP